MIRPVGGRLADRFGGATITLLNFVAMGVSVGFVLLAAGRDSLPLFLVGFVCLFLFSGIGNGSTYKMIPAIFRSRAAHAVASGVDGVTADRDERRLSGAVIGIAGAIGAFGGVLVNLAFRESFLRTGGGQGADLAFLALYVLCVAVTWFCYLRPGSSRLTGK